MMFLWIPILAFIMMYFFKNENKSIYGYNNRTPLDILNEKFMNGELDEAEYRRKKELINR